MNINWLIVAFPGKCIDDAHVLVDGVRLRSFGVGHLVLVNLTEPFQLKPATHVHAYRAAPTKTSNTRLQSSSNWN